MCVCTYSKLLENIRERARVHWLNNKLLENLCVVSTQCATQTQVYFILYNIFEKVCSPWCLCCRATNLESTCVTHKFLNMNSGSSICFCDIYRHLKCHHIRVIIMKYWVVFISLISTDGKIWAQICTKTIYNRHSVNA